MCKEILNLHFYNTLPLFKLDCYCLPGMAIFSLEKLVRKVGRREETWMERREGKEVLNTYRAVLKNGNIQ